jgi:hypothetical protein
MSWRRAFSFALPFAWTFFPIFAVERLADYFYLIDNTSAFYTMSGWRLELFIIFTLTGSVAAGMLLREVRKAAAVEGAALLAALVSFFVLCDPRVCFSEGPQGLEPVRMGFFLASVAFSGAAMGVALRHGPPSKSTQLLTGFFGLAVLGYYPVIFTFAGARLLSPLYPWDIAAVLAIVALPVSVGASLTLGPKVGLLLPLASLAALLVLSVGIAIPYVESLAMALALMTASTLAAATAGAVIVAKSRNTAVAHRAGISGLFVVGLVVVLSMMLLVVPDAVNGVVPSNAGRQPTFSMGVPVYAGAYMEGPPGHALGAEVTVDFAGTNLTTIQSDNFLSAGIGIHSAGCCVDGIDYSYRFDVYLFHGGGETLAASAWEVCDDNAACGGHSWKVLMFFESSPLEHAAIGDNLSLRMEWVHVPAGAEVVWTYSVGGDRFTNYTSFSAPKAENPNFNTGVLSGGTIGPQQRASYFFQFGVMSRYPVGQAGWTVELRCPALFVSAWTCVDHAKTLTGDQSYWKIFWRWGESYPGVSVAAAGNQRIVFVSSTSSNSSFEPLW